MVQRKQLLLISIYVVASVAVLSIVFYLLFGLDGLYLFALINLFVGTGVVWFIVSRKQSFADEEHVKADDEKYRLLFEQASDYIMVTDFQGNFTDVNESLCKCFGYSRSELLTMNISALVDPGQLKENPIDFVALKAGKQVYNERLMLKRDGAGVWVEANVRKFMGDKVLAIARDTTHRREIETELRETESKFRNLSERSLVGIYIIQDDKFQYVNPRFAEIFGYTTDELMQTFPVELVVHEEDRDTTKAYIRERISGEKQSVHYEVRGLKKDGTQIFIEVFGSMTQYKGESSIVGTILDVTDKKIAADLFAKEKEFSELIIKTLPGIFFVRSMTGNFVRWNKNLEIAGGYTPEDVMAAKPYSLIADEDKGRMEAMVDRLFSQGGVESLELNALRKDGSKIPLYLTGAPCIIDGDDYVLGIAIDITQQQKIEEELRLSEQKYRNSTANLYSILEVTDIAYVLINKDFEIVSFNSKAKELGMKELHKDVKTGDPVNSYVPGNKRKNWDKLSSMITKGQHFDYESSYVQTDGSTNWYQFKLFSVMDDQNFLGMVLAITDITERKKGQVHRENIALDLLRRNKDLEQFTYIISHNLRAPVANILGICGILQNSTLDPSERNEFEKALDESAGSLDTVIKDLNYILQETSNVFEKSELVNLPELVNNIKSGIRDIITKENVSIITDFSQVPEILTLKTYLHSIFYNLITNSIKFRKTGLDPEIHITAARADGKIILSFKDNGTGIDLKKNKENLYGLYSRFNFQVPGKGMGLFMVKKQVQILGGKIFVESAVGKGTEFRVELPGE